MLKPNSLSFKRRNKSGKIISMRTTGRVLAFEQVAPPSLIGAINPCIFIRVLPRALQALGARQVGKVIAGQVFVVPNPTAPPGQAKAVAMLVESLLCTFEHLLSAADGTCRGVALKLRRGLTTPRNIFISHDFQTRLAATLKILREVATNNKQGPRRWRWFDDDGASLTRFQTRAKKLGKPHQSQVASLVTRADGLSQRYRKLSRKMRLRELLSLSYSFFPDKASASDSSSVSQGRLAKDETQCCA